jgi:hypothetical protein
MKRLLMRLRWFAVAVISVVVLVVVASALAPQRVIPMKSLTTVVVSDVNAPPLRLTPIRPNRLVFLELLDFGYTPGSAQADELRYDRFFLEDGSLSRSQYDGRETVAPPRYRGLGDVSGPLVVTGRTKIAMNLDRSDTAVNLAPIPVLVGKLPWRYTSFGTPLVAYPRERAGWLRHSLTITQVGDDGIVVLMAGRSRVVLRPGGAVTVERSLGWWCSAVTIHNRGIVIKSRIKPSAGLRVED